MSNLVISSNRSCPTCGENSAYFINSIELVLPSDHPFEKEYKALVCEKCTTFFCDTNITETKIEKYYQSLSKYQDKNTGTGGSESMHDLLRFKNLVNFINRNYSAKTIGILDVGCARGGLLLALKKEGYLNLNGIDPSPICIEEVKNTLKIQAITGTTNDISLFNKKFDLIILSHVLEHLIRPREAIEVVHSSLCDDGMIYIEVPDPSRFYLYETTPFQEFNTEHINHFGQSALCSLMESCGFVQVELKEDFISTPMFPQYPVLRSLWKKSLKRSFSYSFDKKLYEEIKSYNLLSANMLKKISTELDSLDPGKLAIFGAGQFCYKLLALPFFKKNIPQQIVDNSSINIGREILNITIQKPEELKLDVKYIIIATMSDPEKISDQLKKVLPDANLVFLNKSVEGLLCNK